MLCDILNQKSTDVRFVGESPRKSKGPLFGNDSGAVDIGATTEQAGAAAGTEVEGTQLRTMHCDGTGELW